VSGTLRYKITSWTQLNQCLSNNDPDLKASCATILDVNLRGTVVRVTHKKYGCLFAYLVDGSGVDIENPPIPLLTPKEILTELRRFGFYVVYDVTGNLSGTMIEYLITLDKLGYDKIRYMLISEPTLCGTEKDPKYFVTAFKIKDNPEWINNTYRARTDEFQAALMNGSAINITAISEEKHFDWSFLRDYVLNISDIIEEYSR
jgi:hypothetical protein